MTRVARESSVTMAVSSIAMAVSRVAMAVSMVMTIGVIVPSEATMLVKTMVVMVVMARVALSRVTSVKVAVAQRVVVAWSRVAGVVPFYLSGGSCSKNDSGCERSVHYFVFLFISIKFL